MATIETPKLTLLRGILPRLSHVTRAQITEYAPTFLTEFAVMVSQIVVYKLAAHYLGKQGFSEYALARRTITLIFPITVLGLSIGLPRYIGFSKGQNNLEAADSYYGATLLSVGSAGFLCALLLNVFAGWFAYLFFGDRSYRFLVFPLSVMIVGLCLHSVACSYHRGHMQLNRANRIQFLNLGVAPLVVFLLVGNSVRTVLLALGLAWSVVGGFALLLTPLWSVFRSNSIAMKDILRYGIQRVPGDFIFMALFALPSTFTAHLSGVQQAGFVAFGITVLSTIRAFFTPIGLVLLPKATLMMAEGARRELRGHVWLILKTCIASALLIAFVLWTWIPGLVRLYLGNDFGQIVFIVRVLVFGALPLSLYLVLRILIDAYHEYAVTGAILLAGFSTFLIGSFIGKRLHAGTDVILISLVFALSVLAVLASFEWRRILRNLDERLTPIRQQHSAGKDRSAIPDSLDRSTKPLGYKVQN